MKLRWSVVLLVVALAFAARATGVRFNVTESIPRGLYQTRARASEVRIGELVCFGSEHAKAPAEARRYLGGQLPLLKVVAAVAGSVVELDSAKRQLKIDGVAVPCSEIHDRDSAGTFVPRVRYPLVIPKGSVWLMSLHPFGFDSRYFGPVALEALVCGDARPLWTWGGVKC